MLHISRLLFEFQDKHPEIEIDFGLTDARIDLVREGVAIAIRLGPLTDSSLKMRALGLSRRLLVAAPGYLARHGAPATPGELASHEGIRMSNVAGSDTLALLDADGTRHVVPFGGRLRVDHGLAAREAVLAGRGIAPAHRWLVDDLIADGRLRILMPRYALPSVPLTMLIMPERSRLARVRVLIDFLVENITRIPGIDAPGAAGRS